jgi:hypothetical protein
MRKHSKPKTTRLRCATARLATEENKMATENQKSEDGNLSVEEARLIKDMGSRGWQIIEPEQRQFALWIVRGVIVILTISNISQCWINYIQGAELKKAWASITELTTALEQPTTTRILMNNIIGTNSVPVTNYEIHFFRPN